MRLSIGLGQFLEAGHSLSANVKKREQPLQWSWLQGPTLASAAANWARETAAESPGEAHGLKQTQTWVQQVQLDPLSLGGTNLHCVNILIPHCSK